jgi:hypothetical protein
MVERLQARNSATSLSENIVLGMFTYPDLGWAKHDALAHPVADR